MGAYTSLNMLHGVTSWHCGCERFPLTHDVNVQYRWVRASLFRLLERLPFAYRPTTPRNRRLSNYSCECHLSLLGMQRSTSPSLFACRPCYIVGRLHSHDTYIRARAIPPPFLKAAEGCVVLLPLEFLALAGTCPLACGRAFPSSGFVFGPVSATYCCASERRFDGNLELWVPRTECVGLAMCTTR